MGLHLSLRAYQTYVFSVLSFILQLENMPTNFHAYEQAACKALFPGPRCWMVPDIFRHLRTLGFPSELADMQVVSVAAKSRVCRTEALRHGGLRVHQRAKRLQGILDRCPDLRRLAFVSSFSFRAFLFQISGADMEVDTQVARRRQLDKLPSSYLRWEANRLEGRAQAKSWQAVARHILTYPAMLPLHIHLRSRLDGFQLSTLPGHRVRRALAFLKVLAPVVAPRVFAAYLRTVCHGWLTQHRFGRRGRCRFGCEHGNDTMNHIMRCPMIHKWSQQCSQLIPPAVADRSDVFLCFEPSALDTACLPFPCTTNDVLRARGWVVYAAYRLHNGIRCGLHDRGCFGSAFCEYYRRAQIASTEDDA